VPLRSGPPRAVRTVLVVLEGLWSMVPVVRFLHQSLADLPDGVVLSVRAHPVLPVEPIAARAGVPLDDPRLRVDRSPTLADALATADVVAYAGSTSALEALHAGIPVIHVDVSQLGPEDPLFRCDALTTTVRSPHDLG